MESASDGSGTDRKFLPLKPFDLLVSAPAAVGNRLSVRPAVILFILFILTA